MHQTTTQPRCLRRTSCDGEREERGLSGTDPPRFARGCRSAWTTEGWCGSRIRCREGIKESSVCDIRLIPSTRLQLASLNRRKLVHHVSRSVLQPSTSSRGPRWSKSGSRVRPSLPTRSSLSRWTAASVRQQSSSRAAAAAAAVLHSSSSSRPGGLRTRIPSSWRYARRSTPRR